LKRWKILIFTRGIPTFSHENENEAIGVIGGTSQDIFFMHRAYWVVMLFRSGQIHTVRNHGHILGKCCIFPKFFLFFSQNGQIIRLVWDFFWGGDKYKFSQNVLIIFPSASHNANLSISMFLHGWVNVGWVSVCIFG